MRLITLMNFLGTAIFPRVLSFTALLLFSAQGISMPYYFNVDLNETHQFTIEGERYSLKLVDVEYFWEPNLWLVEHGQKSLKEAYVLIELNGERVKLWQRPYQSPVHLKGLRIYVENTKLFAESGEFEAIENFQKEARFAVSA